MPALFVAGGGPDQIDDEAWLGELRAWGRSLPRPRAILLFSAHWETAPIALGATKTVPLIYDFSGFPERYYDVKYPAPGAPELAERVRALLRERSVPFREAPSRGLDHGAYLPLVGLFPEADIPVLLVSLPTLNARELFELGRLIAPLRDEGVLIVCAGLLIHNLREVMQVAVQRGGFEGLSTLPGAPDWVREFDRWVEDVVARRDWEALIDYRRQAPHVARALPTHEHFVPLLIAAGAAETGAVTFPITGFLYGASTKRSVQLD